MYVCGILFCLCIVLFVNLCDQWFAVWYILPMGSLLFDGLLLWLLHALRVSMPHVFVYFNVGWYICCTVYVIISHGSLIMLTACISCLIALH